MRRLLVTLSCSLLLPAAAQAAAFDKPAIADDDLAAMRGGFATPGGLDVAIAIDTITSVNGVPLLQSVFRADHGPAQLRVTAADGSGGLSPVDSSNGPVTRDGGTISTQMQSRGAQISFTAPDLVVQHLASGAYGTIIANRADNTAIDTTTTVSLDVRNASALTVGPSMLRADGIAVDAATSFLH
jgi:hypothetical protein